MASTAHVAATSQLAKKYNLGSMQQLSVMQDVAYELNGFKQEFERYGFFVAKSAKDKDRYFHEKKFPDGAWAVGFDYHPGKLVARRSPVGRKRLFGYIITFFSLLKDDPFFPYARAVNQKYIQKDTQAKYMLWSNVQQALEDKTVHHALLMYLLGLYRFLTEPKWKEVLTKANTTVKQEVGAYNAYWHKNMEKGKMVFQAAFGLITAYDAGTPLYYTQQPVRDPQAEQINRAKEPLDSMELGWVTKQCYASYLARELARGNHKITGYCFRPLGLTQGARANIDSVFFDFSWATLPWAERVSAYWFRTNHAQGIFPQVLYAKIAAYVGTFPYERSSGYQKQLNYPPDTSQWMTFSTETLYREKRFLAVDMMYERLNLDEPWRTERKKGGYENKSAHVSASVTLSNAIKTQRLDGCYYLPLYRSDSQGYAWLKLSAHSPSNILTSPLLSKAAGFFKLRAAAYFD